MRLNAKFFLKKREFLDILEGNLKHREDSFLKEIINILNIADSEDDINIDLVDVKKVLEDGDNVFILVIKDNDIKVVKEELDNIPFIKSSIVYFCISENYSLLNIQDMMNFVEEKSDENGDIIFGSSMDNSLEDNEFLILLLGVT